jgi:hypothetical protein
VDGDPLTMVYRTLVFVHVLAVLSFVGAHGGPIAIMLRIRRASDPSRIRADLEMSRDVVGFIHLTLFLVLATGVALAFVGGLWMRGWIWASFVVLVLMWVSMYWLGTSYYDKVRLAVGAAQFYGKMPEGPTPAALTAGTRGLLRSSRPVVLAAVGSGGLILLVWLMMFKPF